MTVDKDIGKLQGQVEGMEKQVSAIFKNQTGMSKDVGVIKEAAVKGLALVAEHEKRLNKVEPVIETHAKHHNRLVGYLVGSAGVGSAAGYVVSLFSKKFGG